MVIKIINSFQFLAMSATFSQQPNLKQTLQQIFSLIAHYDRVYLYNGALVDPYLLASYGIIPSKKHFLDQAICSNPNCDLTIEFDMEDNNQKMEDIELAVEDHDKQCVFSKIEKNFINFKLFSILGNEIFKERIASLRARGIQIQLNPKDIAEILKIQELNQTGVNFILEQFMILDCQISKKCISKVTSSIFLAVFGWQWTQSNSLICRFCGVKQDVRDFISPSQFSLMRVQEGFSFVHSHNSWCCLVEPSRAFWKEILRQASFNLLSGLPGKFSRSKLQIHQANIQRNLIDIFSSFLPKINELQKRIQNKGESISKKYQNSTILDPLLSNATSLQMILKEQKLIAENMVKQIMTHQI